MAGAGVEERRQDALDLHVRVEILADHLEGPLELQQAAQREVLALHGHNHALGGRERVDGEQAQRGRRVEEDVVVALAHRVEGALQGALAPDHLGERHLCARKVDGGGGHVELALVDDVLDGRAMHEDVVHALVEPLRVDPLAHGEVALGVHVDGEHAQVVLAQRSAEIHGGCGLGYAALLIREGDDMRH